MNALALSLLFGCAGVVLAWLLRRPARRVAGAGPAFYLWLLAPLLAGVAWLPAWHLAAAHTASLLTLPALIVAPVYAVAAGHAGVDVAHIALIVWLAGAGVLLARLVVHCTRIARQSRPLPDALRAALEAPLAGLDPHIIRLHRVGPAVCWLPRCRLLLPPDVLKRFDPEQRVQVLAHERMHLVRHDPLWSLLAELTLAALWFFPPVWLAMSRFHLDQELACDAAMVSRCPRQAGAYARALLSGTATPHALAATTPWLSRSQLKERLTMIQHHSKTLLGRRAGYGALIVLLAGTALAAHAAMPVLPPPAAQPATASSGSNIDTRYILRAPASTQSAPADAQSTSSAPVNLSIIAAPPPHYPPGAKTKHEHGTVTLLVLVGTKGQPLQVRVADTDAPQALVAAAKKAATKWRFSPAHRNGKPIRAWARVPVTFTPKPSTQTPVSNAAMPAVNEASRRQHPPVYPPAAKKNHKQGTVVLLVLVNKQGQPTTVKVEHSAAPALDQAAVKAAKQWQFSPGIRDGKPYKAWVRVPVTFSIQKRY